MPIPDPRSLRVLSLGLNSCLYTELDQVASPIGVSLPVPTLSFQELSLQSTLKSEVSEK